jgi:protein-S-isoprenylcysteine O-methyltransferase Ste14
VGERLSRFGAGPRTLAPCMAYTVVIWLASRQWPDIVEVEWVPEGVRIAGLVLIAAGLIIWAAGVVTVMRAYKRDQLVTSGVFALVRHPVYAGWITLIFPGLALYCRAWPMLLTPLLGYVIFRRLIHVEDEYLTERFGQAYIDYCQRVNEIVPLPRLGTKSA